MNTAKQPAAFHCGLVFADVDGTLIRPDASVSPRTLAALERIRAAAIPLILCTGRSRHTAEHAMATLRHASLGMVLNGALLIDWSTGRVLRRALIDPGVAGRAAEMAESLGAAAIWHGAEEVEAPLLAKRGSALWPMYEERNRHKIRYVGSLREIDDPAASLVCYGSPDAACAIAGAWQEAFGDIAAACAGPTAGYNAWYAQMSSREGTKEAAAAYIAGLLGIPREQTVAIGDHRNDAGMLRWAGTGICMGDGDAEALAAADIIAGTLAEDGAAIALENIVFKSGSSVQV